MNCIISFRKPCGCDKEDKAVYKDTLFAIGLIFIGIGSTCLYNWVNHDPYGIGIHTSRNLTLVLLIGGILFVLFSFIKIRCINSHYTEFSQPFLL